MEDNTQDFYLLCDELEDNANLAQLYFEENISFSNEIHSFFEDKGNVCKQMRAYIKKHSDMNLAEHCTSIRRDIFTRLLQSANNREEKQSIADISKVLYKIEKWFISRKYGITIQEAEKYYIHSDDGTCRHQDTDDILQPINTPQLKEPQPTTPIAQETKKQKQLRDYILIDKKDELITELHTISQYKSKGRWFASLIQACCDLALIDKPPFSVVEKEFKKTNDVGSNTGYDNAYRKPNNDKINTIKQALNKFQDCI